MKSNLIKYSKPFGAIFFWGVSFVATKELLNVADLFTIVFLRFSLGALFIYSVAVLKKINLSLTKNQFLGTLLLAIAALIHLGIQLTGMKFTTASNTGWIIATSPIFISVVGFIIFKEKLSLLNAIGMIIAFFGVLLLIGNGDLNNVDMLKNKGDFLVLLSAFTWAIYSAANKKFAINMSQTAALLYVFLFISLILAPIFMFSKGYVIALNFSFKYWLLILFLGFFTSGLAYILWAKALQELPSNKVGSFIYVEPFITVLASAFFLGEELTINSFICGLIIVIGVILSNSQKEE
jgi:drug/metabolite transporter (DMT)-like permease